jgi:hypothetical protein
VVSFEEGAITYPLSDRPADYFLMTLKFSPANRAISGCERKTDRYKWWAALATYANGNRSAAISGAAVLIIYPRL